MTFIGYLLNRDGIKIKCHSMYTTCIFRSTLVSTNSNLLITFSQLSLDIVMTCSSPWKNMEKVDATVMSYYFAVCPVKETYTTEQRDEYVTEIDLVCVPVLLQHTEPVQHTHHTPELSFQCGQPPLYFWRLKDKDNITFHVACVHTHLEVLATLGCFKVSVINTTRLLNKVSVHEVIILTVAQHSFEWAASCTVYHVV